MDIKKDLGIVVFTPAEVSPAPDIFPVPAQIPIAEAVPFSARLSDRAAILTEIAAEARRRVQTRDTRLLIATQEGRATKLNDMSRVLFRAMTGI